MSFNEIIHVEWRKDCNELQRALNNLKKAIEESAKDYNNKKRYDRIIVFTRIIQQEAKSLTKSIKRWKKNTR